METTKDRRIHCADRSVNRPNVLLDAIRSEFKLRNDTQLADVLKLEKPMISKTRRDPKNTSPWLLIAVLEFTGWPWVKVKELKELSCQANTSTIR